ncbi:MAG: type I restriction-modification system subunit M N-terminal domain-containing protein, partial [Eubacterium sp.]|nr:type I restriction-modification system subunit M N-terminal domain-containing protein [Eubacterium sp.]
MADMKKEQERDELHRAIWAIADELRGAVDGWDFKNYVLGTMFYRYISENITAYINQGEADAGNPDFDYEEMPDDEAEEARDGLINEKGFFIIPSELFCNVRKRAATDSNLNETLDDLYVHDALTGLYNRFGLSRYGQQYYDDMLASEGSVQVVF